VKILLFVERGVEFLIFPDGSFDFNTEFGNQVYGDYYRGTNRSRRGSINATYGAPGTHVNYTRPRRPGTLVTHDRWGNVRRVGNVFINYDWYGRVKRLGSVYVRYNRRGLISQVGGLRLIYARNGRLIRTTGFVNYHNQGCGFCGTTSCSVDHFGDGNYIDWHDGDYDDDDDDDDFYYYRQNGKQKKFKRKKFKKRYKDDDDD